VLRRQLSAAFLAGVAESQDELLLRPSRSLVDASVRKARTLLKNRAASHDCRLWHAFSAGARAARAPGAMELRGQRPQAHAGQGETALRLFVRQPLTESGPSQQALVAQVLKRIEEHDGHPHAFRYLAGREAQCAESFRAAFEAESGQPFTPQRFRARRLRLLAQADAFINIRVGLSESSAFELSYHVFRGACTPVLFLVWKQAPIKTTLLKELSDLCDVTYIEFEHADDVRDGLGAFFDRCQRARQLPGS
jgi:carbamoyl-phosphate synthase large subunit